MKKVVSVWLSLLLVFSSASVAFPQGSLDQRVTELSQQISKEMTENQKRTIAVIEFADLRGNVTDFGRFLAEELITRLYQTKKFKVIERQLITKVIAEQKLSLTGIIDPASAKQLGKLLGVDAIVSGTVTDLSQSLRVNARLISAETGEIFAVASTEIFKDEQVRILINTRLTTGPSKPPEDPGKGGPRPPPPPIMKKEEMGFTFELKRCKMSSRNITCELLITNNDEDRELQLTWWYSANSKMVDNLGSEYWGGQRRLGSQVSDNQAVSTKLFSGAPTRAEITFNEVAPEAKEIVVFELLCETIEPRKGFTVQFRNIQIVK